ncbi:hypothetical protein CLMAG_62340 [Clostridium magnum DSM 2767]|uniref:Uncharacterized protein n=1 Tax=Clostridium magnum DSM 2767 TaxID=1121326 RepID=A0A161YEP8_9CLOT|nr:hypothetical protein CLMAG_62340 [Clostridium magnum DSM 2767]
MVYLCRENDYSLTLVKEEVNNYGKKKERNNYSGSSET